MDCAHCAHDFFSHYAPRDDRPELAHRPCAVDGCECLGFVDRDEKQNEAPAHIPGGGFFALLDAPRSYRAPAGGGI